MLSFKQKIKKEKDGGFGVKQVRRSGCGTAADHEEKKKGRLCKTQQVKAVSARNTL